MASVPQASQPAPPSVRTSPTAFFCSRKSSLCSINLAGRHVVKGLTSGTVYLWVVGLQGSGSSAGGSGAKPKPDLGAILKKSAERALGGALRVGLDTLGTCGTSG